MKSRPTRAGLLLALALPWSLSGCAGIEVLHASAQCPGGPQREVRLTQDPSELARLWRGANASPVATPAPALAGRRALYLADDEHPTAGYAMTLASPVLKTQLGVASLSIRTERPEGMTAQVVTRPCLLLALPAGDYERVEVRDQNGREWGSASLAK